jgi:O-antigen/teichoic acid export membrane protein
MSWLRRGFSLFRQACRQVRTRGRVVKAVSALASANLVVMLLSVAGAIIQARFVGPEDMGVFRTFGIVLQYMVVLHLGTFDGLQRDIPRLIGAGRRDRAEQLAAACLAWILLVCVVGGAGFAIAGIAAFWQGDAMVGCGWLASIFMLWAGFYGGYLATTYRTGHEFVRLSSSTLLGSAVSTALLPLVPFLQYYGVCLRNAAGSAASTWRLHKYRPLPVRPRLSARDLLAVLRFGAPLFLLGYIGSALWEALEGTIIRDALGVTALGLFSVVTFGRGAAWNLLMSVHQVVMPRVAEEYGRSGRISACVRVCALPTALTTLGVIPLAAAGWFLSRPLVEVLLPKYVDCIPALQWMWLGMIPMALRTPLTVLSAAAHVRGLAVSTAAGFGAFCALAWFSIRCGWGLPGIVNATTIGWLLYDLVGMAFIGLAVRRERMNA